MLEAWLRILKTGILFLKVLFLLGNLFILVLRGYDEAIFLVLCIKNFHNCSAFKEGSESKSFLTLKFFLYIFSKSYRSISLLHALKRDLTCFPR